MGLSKWLVASSINWFHGQLLDVYNSSMDNDTIWINSLYLYSDKIVIETFDTMTGTIMPELTRTISLKDGQAVANQQPAA